MAIPVVMLSDEIKASDDYSEYLAKSKGKNSKRSRRRPTGVVIDGEAQRESDEEEVDHLMKLKGIEMLSTVAQFKLDLKKARKASKDDFILQEGPKSSGEGSDMAPEVLDGLSLKGPNEGSGVISTIPDEPSSCSSSSRSESEIKDISSNDESDGAEDNEKVKAEKAEEEKIEKPEATILSSSQTLSSAKYGNRFINDNPDVSLTDVLKETVEVKFITSGYNRLTRLEKKVEAMSRFNLPEAIKKLVQAHLKIILPKDVPGFAHRALYDALVQSLIVDEDDMDKQLEDQSTPKKRRRDNNDQDPSAGSEKEKKKRKQKDSKSSKKDEDQVGSSMKSKSLSKSSKTDKSINAEDIIHDVEMDVGESIKDDMADAEDPTQADANVPKQDKSTWFKKVVDERPESPDLEWHKELIVDDGPEQTWFNEMVNAEKNQRTFDDVMGSVIDFTNFSKNRLKKDKITKADLEGPAFILMKGRHKNYLELEYNFKQYYLALSD
ncbi:hypothetical protein Tco_0446696, partial [Tanacetum coccineum]